MTEKINSFKQCRFREKNSFCFSSLERKYPNLCSNAFVHVNL